MPELQSARLLKSVMRTYFKSFGAAKKVAWCTSVGPAELLRAFGFEVFFPENHGALLGATRTAGPCIPYAVAEGYSGDICSYLTSDIGAWLSKTSPLSAHYQIDGIPKPDLIVYSTNQCREVQDWFSWFGNKFGCPVAGILPPRHLEEVTETEVNDVAGQFRELVHVCERVTGRKFDTGKFSETVRLSKEATDLWQEVLGMARLSPAPINFFDGVIHMGPIVVLRGTEQAVNYYRMLLKELKEIAAAGGDAERSRIYWDGMPIWGKLRSLSELFRDNNASVVASTYCNSWIFNAFDPADPFVSTARAYTEIFINRGEGAKLKILRQMAEEFRIDGFLFHDAKTCFNNSNTRFGLPARLTKETGIPSLVIEGDLCDLRFYSEGQTVTKIETFLEQIATGRKISMV